MKKIYAFIERYCSVLSVILALIISTLIRFNIFNLSNGSNLLNNMITVTSIFNGILMSMMGFLLTVSGRAVVKRIREMEVHKIMLGYFIKPIFVGLIIIIMSMIYGTIFNKDVLLIDKKYIIMSMIWMVLVVYFCISVIRILILMYKILFNVFDEIGKEEKDMHNTTIKTIEDIYVDENEDNPLDD